MKFLYHMVMPVSDLSFGVSRPQRWWDRHQDIMESKNKIAESISLEGLRNPLTVTETDGKYTVEVGNLRLQAMQDLGVETASCIVISKNKKTIPHIETNEELEALFKDGCNGALATLHPADKHKWS
mgnify:CR=1 FL=1